MQYISQCYPAGPIEVFQNNSAIHAWSLLFLENLGIADYSHLPNILHSQRRPFREFVFCDCSEPFDLWILFCQLCSNRFDLIFGKRRVDVMSASSQLNS